MILGIASTKEEDNLSQIVGGYKYVRELEQESWIDWIKRCTHLAETHLHKAALDDWVGAQRRRKWRLAGPLLEEMTSDGPKHC